MIMISEWGRLTTITLMYMHENCLLSPFPLKGKKKDYWLISFFNKIQETEEDTPVLD